MRSTTDHDAGYALSWTTNANESNLYHRTEEDTVDRATWPDRPIAGPDGAPVRVQHSGRRHRSQAPLQEGMYLPDFENPMDANRDNVYEVNITVEDS